RVANDAVCAGRVGRHSGGYARRWPVRWEMSVGGLVNDAVAILKRDHREVEQFLRVLAASKPGRAVQLSTRLSTRPRSTYGSKSSSCIRWWCGRSARTRPKKPRSS